MVKPADHRGTLWSGSPSHGIDRDEKRFDANLVQHRAEERGFVLTISVAMRENLRRRMGLPSANSQFDCDVADITLDELRERLHLRKLGGCRRRERGHFLFDFRRSVPAALFEPCLPVPHLLPILEAPVCATAQRKKRNHQEPGNSVQGWHFVLGLDCFYVANDPMRLIPRLAWLGFRIIDPCRFVLPSGRKLKSGLSLAHGVLFLKGPDILQDER